MKIKSIISLSWFLISLQFVSGQTQLLPEFSAGVPIGAFGEDTFNTDKVFGAGLHIEKQNIWKVFGLGLYAGYHSYETNFVTAFPNQINDTNLQSRIFVDGENLNWQSLQAAIGPTINFNLSNKLQLQGFTKAGLSQITYPEYRYYVDVTSPTNEQFTLFEANTPGDTKSDFNFMIISGLRFNYSLSRTFGLSVGANFTHIKGLTHTYTPRNIDITGNESSGELFDILLDSEETTKTYECNINTINGTIGIVINLGGNSNPPEEEPEIPTDISDPVEDYTCQSILYQAPGYNAHVVLSETPYAIFQWTDENAKKVKDDKGYQLLFYIKENGEYKEVDKRNMPSKKRFKIGLNPNKSYPDNSLYWKITPVNRDNNAFCPETTKLMRLLVFKDENEALTKLPECLTQLDENKPKDTNFFKAPNKN